MRLWTLHPKYLDARGLVALWREALLAQAVLSGKTRGYVGHPQLVRFRGSPSPLESIAFYLQVVCTEGARRGYQFDADKIGALDRIDPIVVPRGQLDYEAAHLKGKLKVRAPSFCAKLESASDLEAHPLFQIVAGSVAEWEVIRTRRR